MTLRSRPRPGFRLHSTAAMPTAIGWIAQPPAPPASMRRAIATRIRRCGSSGSVPVRSAATVRSSGPMGRSPPVIGWCGIGPPGRRLPCRCSASARSCLTTAICWCSTSPVAYRCCRRVAFWSTRCWPSCRVWWPLAGSMAQPVSLGQCIGSGASPQACWCVPVAPRCAPG